MADDRLHELVRRSQARDSAAFAQLVAETQTGTYNLAYSIVGNREEAEDLVQETYLRVWQALPQFRGDARFTTWLYRITTNACLNRRRALHARLREIDDEGVLGTLTSPGPSPAHAAATSDRQRRVWAAVEQLPEKYRIVITLLYQEQLSYQEIAAVLALPLGTVKAHLNRARQALAHVLEAERETEHAPL